MKKKQLITLSFIALATFIGTSCGSSNTQSTAKTDSVTQEKTDTTTQAKTDTTAQLNPNLKITKYITFGYNKNYSHTDTFKLDPLTPCQGNGICCALNSPFKNSIKGTCNLNPKGSTPNTLIISFSISDLQKVNPTQATQFRSLAKTSGSYTFSGIYMLYHMFGKAIKPTSQINATSTSVVQLGADGDTMTDTIIFQP